MNTVSNQKTITVSKTECGKGELSAIVNMNSMNQALGELSGNAFKLYMYMAKNCNDYTFALSSKDATNVCGICRGAYDRAVKEMIEKNYLYSEKDNNKYVFNDCPNLNV